MTPWQLRQATHIIQKGGVIAYPTEAVYGLGCDPQDFDAVKNICRLKNRNLDKGLILIASDMEQIEAYIDVTSAQRTQLCRRQPKPVTWIVPASAHCPHWLTGIHDSIAVRITQHSVARALCQAAGHPLVSTSANISKGTAARSALDVRRIFNSGIDLILHGSTDRYSNPSEIRELVSGKILRKH